ncbi:MAG TPA: YCF48-related protein [Marinospirillum sp.]|uniref:WD40/YVTN/BNR-like repeat-containing protein n=1 Tax=Marinospirillum sp. TaxID=2183934 RepID=UPI002B48B5A5|nr:YCF48-related protein [Marinospirillum sp.]HKM16090.1 YCF48-related protein [Marinospirillum sp.]
MVSSCWPYRLKIVCLLLSASFFTPTLFADSALLKQALKSELITQSLLLDITAAGDRLVAVGERGHIIYRDALNKGTKQIWQQAKVPVISQLTGVDFATADLGFAVGHEATILRSSDAGVSWQLVQHDTEEAPLLDVFFISAQTGFAVGGYGLLLKTQDSGKTWQNLSDKLPNPEGYHNNAITQDIAGHLFIVGERGSVYRSTDLGDSWQALQLDYDGSLFGVFSTPAGQLVATGLRGNLFMSLDTGNSWQPLKHAGEQTLNTGLVLDNLGNNSLLLLGQNGEYLTGAAQALNLHTLSGRYSLLAAARQGNEWVAVGRGGIHSLPLPTTADR